MENATDSQTATNDFKFKQSGVSVSVSNPIVDWGIQVCNMYQAAEQTDDERSKRLAALSVAGDGWMTWSEYQEQKKQVNNPNRGEKGNNTLTDFKVTATIGSQSSQANSISYQESNKASSIKAENITLHAFGDNDGDINIVGSQVISKDSTALLANNDINILSGTQLKYSDSDNKNHSVGVGAYVSVGADTSFGLTASGGVGRGNTDSNGKTQTNSQVLAGNLLILDSANDTNIKGATAKAEQVIARAGGDLNIHSRSDNYQLEGKQRQYGGSLNVSLGATMPVSGSVSAELGDSQVNYQSVREQSGIYAGKGGFDITVGGNTDLLGAVIDSKATPDKNRLITTTFSSADITNISEAESTVKSYGIDSQVFSGNLYPIAKTIIANTVGDQGSNVNHHETSQTISAIAEGELIATDADSQARLDTISHDTANTHRYIAPANIDEMMADAKAQQFIKDAFVDTLFKYSDEAHRKMFIAEAPLYRVTKDEKGNFVYTQIKGEEKKNLLSEQGPSPHVFTNGIFNGIEAAGNYAIQNRRDENAKLGQELDLDKNLFISSISQRLTTFCRR